MSRFTSADQLNAYLDWRDDLIRTAGDVPAYRSPEFFAADTTTQMASYQLNEVGRQASDRAAAAYEQRVADRDASHDVSAAGRGQWAELAERTAAGRGAYIPRAAVDRAVDAVAELIEEDQQHDAATSAAAHDTADDTTERAWTA